MAFHPEQRDAGFQLINRFIDHQPFSILLAQMQSGKTGTYLFAAFEMVRQDLVDRVVIICGSSDTSLREQAKRDLDVAYKAFLMETVGDNEGLTNLISADFGVFFSQDLAKIDEIDETTLIIHEESHMAQSKNNIPFKKFYQKNNLDKALMGDFTALKEKNNYILGVSATPFSEIVSNKKVQTGDWTTEESQLLGGVDLDPKNFFFMQPGQGYIGVTDLLLHNSIKFEAENIKTDDCDHIASILRKGTEKYHKKYVVVRSHRAEKDKDMMETIATSCGYNYVSVFGGEKTSLDFMENEPFNKTIVHICGRFRMGQVVPKRFIAMVYEQSVNPNADTILQGLVGRMCGYQAAGSHLDVDIYVSLKAEELVRKYGRAWSEGNMDSLSEVTKAMNLSGSRRKTLKAISKDGIEMMPIHPICIPNGMLKIATKSDLWMLPQCLEEHPELIKCPGDAEEIKHKLRDRLHFTHRCLGTDRVGDEEMLKAGKRVRPGVAIFSVTNDPHNHTFEEMPFILYKRKGSTDYYLGGWVRWQEVHTEDEIAWTAPKVSQICNFAVAGEEPSVEVPEGATKKTEAIVAKKASGAVTIDLTDESPRLDCASHAFSGTNIGSSTTDAPTGECEVYEIGPMPRMVCEVDTTDEFIATVKNLVKKGINSYRPLWMADNPGPVAVHLKKSVFSKDDTKKLEKQLRVELGIKLKIKGPLGRPSQSGDYRKVREISW